MARPFEFDRNQALEKAMLLFWNKGYFNTSAQDIVEHIGLSRSSVYNSFTDKRSLFIEALKHYIGNESKGLTALLNVLPPDKKSLKKILETIVENNFTGEKPKGCLVVNSAIEMGNYDPEIQKIIRDNMDEVIGVFEKFIRKGQKAGNFTKSVPAGELAVSLFHQVTALRVTGKVVSDKKFFQKNIQAYLRLFS